MLRPTIAAAVGPEPAVDADDFRPRPRVSLVLDGNDRQHVTATVAKLLWLRDHRNVEIGSVFIHGMEVRDAPAPHLNWEASLRKSRTGEGSAPLTQPYQTMFDLGLNYYELQQSGSIVSRLKLKHSPAWVVRHLGRDYVFEGFDDIKKYFSSKGEFVRDVQ